MSDNPNVGRVFNLPGSSVPDSLKVHIDSKENPHGVTAQQVGAIPDSVKGLAGGVATLDEMGKVPSEQIPALIARTVLTIPAEGWQADASGGVAIDLPLAGVTENMTPTVTLSAAALETAGACELRETCETLPGAVRFRAESAPGEEMSGELLLVLPSGVAGDMIPAGTIALEELREEVLGENGAVPALETAITDLETGLSETIEGKATELWNELIPLIEAFPPGVVAMYHLDGGTAPPPGWAWYETDEQGAPLPVSESRPGLVYIVRGT